MVKALLSLATPFYEANPQVIEEIKNLGIDLTYLLNGNDASKETIIEQLQDKDIFITGVNRVDKEVLDSAAKLKYILKYGTGVDNIDIDYASKKGIFVTNAPGENASSVADLAIGLMLSISRKIHQADKLVKSRNWEIMIGDELEGKRIGIIGFGNIGQKIAQRALGFAMEIVAYGTYKNEEAAKQYQAVFVDLPELLTTSDYIVICTSLTEATYHLIDESSLKQMKKTAYLINIARGNIVDEAALTEALKQKQIKGAGIDVFQKEPTDSELALLDNVIATPHIGGGTIDSTKRVARVTVQNLKNFLAEKPLLNLVNATGLQHQL
ncbi:NAD(P)-binding domain-containing protein [Bacillaceae bacterium Marseille-Q3522]|nr:NAD(P)-binding domain-containing protein [Bacillaceae bacterium Marseille-Q3522]